MATISFTTDITRQNDIDAGDTFTSIGGGPGASNLSSIVYQGVGAGLRRVNSANTDYGFSLTEGTTRDTTTAAFRTFGFKGWISDFGNLNPNGLRLRLGSAGTAYHEWVMGDDGTIPTPGYVYPSTGGFVIQFVDATLRAWLGAGTVGNPDETAIDVYGITANISATSNGENLSFDALDWIENGFYLVGGDGVDTDGTFDDFVDQDEGEASATNDRTGLWQTKAGVIFFYGRNTIGSTSAGTATATEFTDSFQTLVCPGGFVREGFNGLIFDIRDANTSISLDNISISGQGRSGVKRLFNAAEGLGGSPAVGDVDSTNDVINYPSHGFFTGEQVLYSQENGTGTVVSLTGGESKLVTGTTGAYYYAINVDVDNFAVATSFANALAGTRAALTASTGVHSFTRTPDTRPDFEVVSDATPGTLSVTNTTLNGMRNITLEDGATVANSQLIASQKLILNEGLLQDSIVGAPTVWEGEAFIEADNPGNISGTNFIAGADGGHAIEITTAAATGSPTEYDLSNNTYEGYGADGTLNAVIYNNSGSQIILNILGGDTPTVTNGTGSTTIINNAVTLLVQGVTEGAAVKIVANETVGTITTGDVIFEGLADSSGQASTSFNYEGSFEPSGLDVITRVRASGLPNAGIQDDNGSFTDETTAANSAVAADMNLLPAVPVVNQDRYLFGHTEMFNKIKLQINTAGLGGFTITWQYWKGGSPGGWTNLSNVTDGTNSFANTGVNFIEFDTPTDWAKTTINSQGPFYYVRAAFTAGTVTQSPKGTRCSMNVTRYLPFTQNGVVTSDGLTVTASWVEDTIAQFKP